MNPYEMVEVFEKRVAEYAGARYGVAIDSCTDALLLSLLYRRIIDGYNGHINIPRYTYVGVAYSVINAGLNINFVDMEWSGMYYLDPVNVIDSARRFRRNMYVKGSLYCLSFHWYKHLPIGRGGMILTDDKRAVDILKQMRYDGRTAGVKPKDDNFIYPGYHCYMIPEDAARGLMLMGNIKDYNEDLIENDYTDLSQFPIFTSVKKPTTEGNNCG